MHPIRKASDAGAAFARTRVKPALRRGLAKVEPLDRAAAHMATRRRRIDRLETFYERLRRSYLPRVNAADGELPSVADIDQVEGAVRAAHDTGGAFFGILCADGDLDRAAVTLTRRLLRSRDAGRARSIGQVLQQYDQLRPIADICVALCAMGEPMPDTAWTLFTRNDLALVMRFAPNEYFKVGFVRDPQTAADSLAWVLAEGLASEADARTWLDIACYSFAAAEELSAQAVQRAEEKFSGARNQNDVAGPRARAATLRDWYGRAARAAEPVETPDGEISFALVGYGHPDARRTSTELDDATDTLAALGHLLRHDGLRFTGDAALIAIAERLRKDLTPARRIGSTSGTVRLCTVDRDATSYSPIPERTWSIISGWFMHPLAGATYDMPLNPRLRPIFLSFRIDIPTLAAPGVVDYLRKYAPIGCLDWDTVFLLQAADIPAFFSGAMTATAGIVIEPVTRAEPAEAHEGRRGAGTDNGRRRSLADDLAAAAEALRGYRDGGSPLVTSNPRRSLAARAVGASVDYRPDAAASGVDVEGLVGISEADLELMRRGISDKLAAVLGAVVGGRTDDEVYQTWREACAADVQQAVARRGSVKGFPPLNFDIDKACNAIRSESVTLERTEPGLDGSEVNVEFSLDANYKHQLDIVLDSVVTRTARPVRAFVLCRDHGPDDFARMSRLFPTVSFVWLPTDNVDYGPIAGMNSWVTPATMDRTLLPVLLAEVDRIVHFDVDALSLCDLAELFDVDMAGTAIAASSEPQPRFVSGFETFRRSAARLRRSGDPALARELVIRTHSENSFDFDIFNAGIMVLDLARMRADDFCRRYLPLVQTFGVNGQVILNMYTGRNRRDVGADWNRLIRLEVLAGEPKIVHWAGPYKPWKPFYVTGREIWREGERSFAARVERAAQPVPAHQS